MEQPKTLKSLFESEKNSLAEQLDKLILPREAKKVEKIVADHLNYLLDAAGEYRQSLTQSEEYILQSAMSLLNAQQAMIGALTPQLDSPQHSDATSSTKPTNGAISKDQAPLVVGGTVVGGAAGAIIFNTWGALIGAIAGTALVLYYAAQKDAKPSICQEVKKPASKQLDVAAFLNIVGNICENVDSILDTYRVQVNRIKNVYEQKEKPTLQSEYGTLLEQINNVWNAFESGKDAVPAKLQTAIEMMAESLENYGLKIENGKITNE